MNIQKEKGQKKTQYKWKEIIKTNQVKQVWKQKNFKTKEQEMKLN
jgi:hypothetical protein